MTNIPHKPIGEPDNSADRAELYKHVVAWYQSLPYEPGLGVRTWTVTPEEVVDLIDTYCQAQKPAQPQPLDDDLRTERRILLITALGDAYGAKSTADLDAILERLDKSLCELLPSKPLDDGELRAEISRLATGYRKYVLNETGMYSFTTERKLSKKQFLDKVAQAIAAHSPSTEAAELDARISQIDFLLTDLVTYRNLKNQLDVTLLSIRDELKAQRAALESVTTD